MKIGDDVERVVRLRSKAPLSFAALQRVGSFRSYSRDDPPRSRGGRNGGIDLLAIGRVVGKESNRHAKFEQ
jgi:hypothetical protein